MGVRLRTAILVGAGLARREDESGRERDEKGGVSQGSLQGGCEGRDIMGRRRGNATKSEPLEGVSYEGALSLRTGHW